MLFLERKAEIRKDSSLFEMMLLFAFIISNFLASCFGATDFCKEPLGMKRRIILDGQITESSFYQNRPISKGFQARLDNNQCWCSFTGSTLLQQWVKVDLEYPMSIRGISIQGDPNHNPNYIKKFKLKYSVDGTNFLFKKDSVGTEKEFIGATGQNQKIDRWFDTKPFAARYVEFRPTDFVDNDVCVRFELYGCAYVCNQGLGIESGNALPSGFAMTSSSNGQAASSARLNDASSSWCASTNDQNQYLQIDFGMVMTITGIAVQGNPTADSWVKDFYFDYGMALDSLVTYQEYGSNKLFVGSEDRDTKVTNWFKARLFARYVRIKPISWNGNICMRMEIIGCNTDTMYEIGAENRVLENSRFTASGFTAWVSGRYQAHDGRLNNDRPWGIDSATQADPWFKVDLGRVMLVNGISTQGDGSWGPNYYPDFKIQYSCDENPAAGTLITIKEEASLSVRVFSGNTNNAGVKFNLLTNPISTRHVQFIKNTNPPNVFTLRVEIYGRPQACTTSFGMEAGSQSTYNPTISVSSGTIPVDKAKLNTASAWCAGTDDASQYFQYDFGGIRTISGFAIQGHPTDLKWVKTFKVDYKEQQSQSFTTYQDGGTDKTFVGCKSRNLIVYHWFSTNLRMRFLRFKPLTWNANICLRMNAYGCPKDDCFSELGIQSRATISNALITSSTQVNGNDAHNGRLNMESVWEACQFGSCTPKEANGNKPWIQVCFPSVKRVSSIIVQGPGNFDHIAVVTEFSLKFGASSSGAFQSYIHDGASKKYTVSNGRYTSSQFDLPFSIVSKCIRLQVESQSPANQNAGLRWELLGCNSAPQPSSVTITPSSPSAATNGDVTLTCTANALPGVGLSWKKGSTVLSTSGVYVVGSATPSNDNVKYEVSMTLKITATTGYVTTSFASCVVTSSAQGSAECKQSYECAALYDSLPSSAKSSTMEVTVLGLQAKPTTPSGITHTSLTNTSFSVSWTAPASDFPIKDYKAVIKTKADNNVVETKSGLTSTSASFSGLNPFTEYIVEISAQSSLNVFSNAGTLEVKTDEGVTTAPTNLAASAISATSIRLIWNQPTPLNGILHDYKVRYKMASDVSYGASISVGTQLTFTANFLKPFSDYEFQVQATTKGGLILGMWSSIAASKTLEGFATAPTNLTASAISATSIRLTWNQPTSLNGILHDYKVRYKMASDVSYGASISVGTQLTFTANILKPFSDYEFQVQATTKGGLILGMWSSIAASKTLEGFATAPTNLTASAISATSIRLTWNKPTSPNGILHDYKVRYKMASEANYGASISVGMQLTFTANILKPYTDYEFQVQATTKRGMLLGNWSSVATSKTQEGAPSSPTNLKAAAVSAISIVLTWDPPTSLHGILHDYRVWSNAGHYVNSGNQSILIIYGLKPYTVYQFKVQATTKGGLLLGNWSSVVTSRTQEGAASAPTNVSAVIVSATVVQLTWSQPTSPNGILHDYRVRYKLASNSTYGSSMNVGRKVTATVSDLKMYSDYEFQVQASTKGGSIAGEWSSVLKIKTSIDVIPKPSLRVIPSNGGSMKVSLEKVPSNFDIIKQYRLSIVQGSAADCSQAGIIEVINDSKLPLIIDLKPGVKKVEGLSLEVATIGNHTLCYQAVLKDKTQVRMSEFVTLTIERKSLEKLDPIIYQSAVATYSFVIPMAKGPANTKNYHVIVLEGNASSKNPNEWLPSELGPYDASTYTTGKPYITAVLSSYVAKFSVGDGKEYSLSNRKRRNVGSVIYKNVPLKADTEYLIFQRAYVSQTVYYSSPWLGPIKTSVKKADHAGSEGFSTGNIIAIAVPTPIIIIALATIICIVRLRKSKETVHKGRKNDSLPMEDLKRRPISINNAGFDNLDHGLPHTAEYEEVGGKQSEGVYETINENKRSKEDKYQTLIKRDMTATYQNVTN